MNPRHSRPTLSHPAPERPRGERRLVPVPASLALAAGLALAGCSSPITPKGEQELKEAIVESARRELEHPRDKPLPHPLTREQTENQLEIDPRFMPELLEMTHYEPDKFDIGPDLLGEAQQTSKVSLERAIRTAVANNLEAQFARLSPAISEAQVVAAEAAFDWTFYSNSVYSNLDEPKTVTRQGFSTFGSGVVKQQTESNTTGLRRNLSSGGTVTVQQELSITNDQTPGQTLTPDPAFGAVITAQIDQPLLRGFGSDTTLSQIRLAQNDERDSIANLKKTLIKTVTDTERAYWNLYQTYRALQIRERHLERGIETRDYIRVRWKDVQDATEAQFADSVARVESRLTDVNSARRAFLAASDQLKALMNDPDLTLGSDVLLVPADSALDVPIEYSLTDLLGAALSKRPEVEQAILSIDNTSIRLDVANNGRLPKLDLRLQAKWNGQADDFSTAYDQVFSGQFIDGLIGLNFEMPVGNAGPESIYRRRALERLQATEAYRNTIQQVTLQVITALRNLISAYTQIEQTRNSRLAAANSYRAFKVEKEIKLGNTVDSLNLEFQRQDALAQAELQELAALVGYNASIADLYAAAGTALEHNRIEFKVPDVGKTPNKPQVAASEAGN